jgi:hypothetical protein
MVVARERVRARRTRSHPLARALLVFALLVLAVSGIGFTALVAHADALRVPSPFSGLGGFFSGSSGAVPADVPPCPSPPRTSAGRCAASAALDPAAAPYAHSWYVTNPNTIIALATTDAQWLNAQSTGSTCGRDFLTVLDFAHPQRVAAGNASPLDDYAMALFRQPGPASYRQVEGIAERYLDAWLAAASSCPKLHLALGTSNFNECGGGVSGCDVYAAGQYWDVVAHDVMDYVAKKGYGSRITGVWVADDAETSWDPWPTTQRFLQGVRDQEHTYTAHAQMVNYGDSNVGACSIVVGCRSRWSAQNVYDAAWGLGWALPIPEFYNSTSTKLWDDVAHTQNTQNPMIYAGAMTECEGGDPLPTGACHPQGGGVTGKGACEWSPTIAIAHVQANNPSPSPFAGQSTLYATNMQWPPKTPSGSTAGTPCG